MGIDKKAGMVQAALLTGVLVLNHAAGNDIVPPLHTPKTSCILQIAPEIHTLLSSVHTLEDAMEGKGIQPIRRCQAGK